VTGAAITAVLEWARIAEFRAEGSPVETVRRRLPKRAGGPKHYDALRIPVETDHPFQCKPITDSIPSRSPIPVDADH